MTLTEADIDLVGSLLVSELAGDWRDRAAVVPIPELAAMAGLPAQDVPASLRRLVAAGMLRSYLRDETFDDLEGFVVLKMTEAGHALACGGYLTNH